MASDVGTPYGLQRVFGLRSAVEPAPPLVLIHGMSASERAWDPVLPLLAADRSVHTVALPGHRGGTPIADPQALTSRLYVDEVERQLDVLGIDRADLVGNSLGGWVALQLGARGRATSVVCLAPAGGWRVGGAVDRYLTAQFGMAYRACRRLNSPRGRRVLRRSPVHRALLHAMVAHPGSVSTEALIGTVEDIARCEALRHSLRRPAARDLRMEVPVSCPVLLAWSERDRILVSTRSRRRLERRIGSPEVIELPGVGHVPMSDAPVLVARTILEFTAR